MTSAAGGESVAIPNKSSTDDARTLAARFSLPFVVIPPVAADALALVPVAYQQENRLVVFRLQAEAAGQQVWVAVEDPSRSDVLDDLRFQLGRPLKVHVASPEDIDRALLELSDGSADLGEPVVMGEVVEEEVGGGLAVDLDLPAEWGGEPAVADASAFDGGATLELEPFSFKATEPQPSQPTEADGGYSFASELLPGEADLDFSVAPSPALPEAKRLTPLGVPSLAAAPVVPLAPRPAAPTPAVALPSPGAPALAAAARPAAVPESKKITSPGVSPSPGTVGATSITQGAVAGVATLSSGSPALLAASTARAPTEIPPPPSMGLAKPASVRAEARPGPGQGSKEGAPSLGSVRPFGPVAVLGEEPATVRSFGTALAPPRAQGASDGKPPRPPGAEKAAASPLAAVSDKPVESAVTVVKKLSAEELAWDAAMDSAFAEPALSADGSDGPLRKDAILAAADRIEEMLSSKTAQLYGDLDPDAKPNSNVFDVPTRVAPLPDAQAFRSMKTAPSAGNPAFGAALEQLPKFSEQDLKILDSIERMSRGEEPVIESEKVRPAQMVAALIRLLMKKGVVGEMEFLEELSRK